MVGGLAVRGVRLALRAFEKIPWWGAVAEGADKRRQFQLATTPLLLRPPDWKFTPHALGLKTGSALVVADQYCTCCVPIVKGWPAGSVGPGSGTLGSMR